MKKIFGALSVLVLVLAACGGADAEIPDGSSVAIEGFAFGTSNLSVAVGTVVTFDNKDSAPHTVTADDGSFNESVGAGGTAEVKFDSVGTFAYHCEIHPSMTATVTVEG